MPGTSSRRRAVREHMKELHFSDLSPGLARVSRVMGRPAGSTGFCRVIVLAGLLLNPNRSNHWIDPPGQAGFNNYGLNIIVFNYLNKI
jgi:hypothetical protein